MTTRNKNFDTNKYARAVDILVEKTNKDLNLSNSDESYEEYTPRELEYIDKYKPIALYRMEDQELYEIITKHKFNHEKIENEIKEFVKLINIKGDDYGWSVIDEGKKKKLFLNDKSSKKDALNYQNKGYEDSYQTYDSYNNKKYNSWNKYNPKYKNSNYNNYYNKNNYNTQAYSEENPTNNHEIMTQEVTVDSTNEVNKNRESNNYSYKNNYYSTYNSYRGGRGKRGRGFNRGRYKNNNYSRDDWIFEKEFGNEEKEINGETTENKEEKENRQDNAYNRYAETNENNQEENQADEAPEDDFIEQETPATQTQNGRETEAADKTITENKENVVVYETLGAEEIFENPTLLNKNKSVVNLTQNTQEVLEIVSQTNKDAFKTSSPIKESIKEDSNKKKNTYNSFTEIVSSNVQNFSFLGNPSINTKQNAVESSVNSNNTSTKQQNSQQEFSIPSQQANNLNNNNNNNNKSENKFNLPNNNFNQPQANMNGNYQDFYNAYQMQLSALLSQNMPSGSGPQQMYPMPLVYYPPGGAVGNASDPSMNYGNLMPYMGYPMGYYINPQQMTQQQQSNLKDTSDMQNKNRKINNFDYNSQQQLQNAPYSPYLYMNSQYPMNSGVPMSGINQGMGMNMMGYNFDQMSALNQMNMPSNYDPQNFNQKK